MQSLDKQDIQVIIIDDSKSEECEASCGVDWSSAEPLSLASQRIRDRFGNRVRLEYIDLSKPMNSQRYLDLTQKIKDMPLPLLVIDGESRISGRFDIRMLLDAIEAEIEIRPEGRREDKGGKG